MTSRGPLRPSAGTPAARAVDRPHGRRARLPASTGLRVVQLGLVGLIFLGSLVMSLVIPVAGLWLASRLSDDYFTVYGLALIICPLTMILWGMGLARLNRLYLRVSDKGPGPRRACTGRQRPSARDSPSALEVSMTAAVLIAVAIFAVWSVFFGWGNSGFLGPFPD